MQYKPIYTVAFCLKDNNCLLKYSSIKTESVATIEHNMYFCQKTDANIILEWWYQSAHNAIIKKTKSKLCSMELWREENL